MWWWDSCRAFCKMQSVHWAGDLKISWRIERNFWQTQLTGSRGILREIQNVIRILKCVKYCQNIAKGTTDPRVEFISQVAHKSWSNFILQNLEQVSTSKSQTSRLKLNLKILAKPSFRISTKIQITSTKHQQKKTYQTPASNLVWTST